MGFPPGGAERDTLRIPLESAYIRELGRRAWRAMGKHWEANKSAFTVLDKLPPEGMEAMTRYFTRHLLKHLPESGVTEQVFWDEYMLHMLRMDHQHLEQDETLPLYLQSRIGKPGWEHFLKRFVRILDGKESPEFTQPFLFCMLWDLYPMPLRFWADTATVNLFSGFGGGYNLDKIRNMRRELGLKRNAVTIVKSFLRKEPARAGEKGRLTIEIDEVAAKKCGFAVFVPAFVDYLKGDGTLGL